METKSAYFQLIRPNRKGQGMVEYGLIIGAVALVVLLALTTMGEGINGWFETFSTAVNAASGGG